MKRRCAFIFSGQGSQFPGMGKLFYDSSKSVRSLYEAAEMLRPGTMEIAFGSDAAALRDTRNTQPCLYLAALAGAIALGEKGIHADFAAGFSLGELPALAYAGAFTYEDGFRLVCRRAELMAECAASNPAKMIAVMKLPDEKVEEICHGFAQAYPVNYNCPGQLVCAVAENIEKEFVHSVSAAGGKVLTLAVSGGFHSPFMDKAAVSFAEFLKDFILREPEIPVYSNYSAQPYVSDIASGLLFSQINHPVKWQKIIQNMSAEGADVFIEVGAGATLKKFVEKILPGVAAYSIQNYEDISDVSGEVGHTDAEE